MATTESPLALEVKIAASSHPCLRLHGKRDLRSEGTMTRIQAVAAESQDIVPSVPGMSAMIVDLATQDPGPSLRQTVTTAIRMIPAQVPIGVVDRAPLDLESVRKVAATSENNACGVLTLQNGLKLRGG